MHLLSFPLLVGLATPHAGKHKVLLATPTTSMAYPDAKQTQPASMRD